MMVTLLNGYYVDCFVGYFAATFSGHSSFGKFKERPLEIVHRKIPVEPTDSIFESFRRNALEAEEARQREPLS